MRKKTLKALQGSIEKWEKIVAGTDYDRGVDNCPLCQRFYNKSFLPCMRCPVKKRTGVIYCNKTPYRDYKDAVSGYRLHVSERNRMAVEDCAVRELNFLKSLLPKSIPSEKWYRK